jgi:hypothetical protein
MLNKIRQLPEKTAFTIGLSLLFISPVVMLFSSLGYWMTIVVQGLVGFVSVLFILSAADKRHSRKRKNK